MDDRTCGCAATQGSRTPEGTEVTPIRGTSTLHNRSVCAYCHKCRLCRKFPVGLLREAFASPAA